MGKVYVFLGGVKTEISCTSSGGVRRGSVYAFLGLVDEKKLFVILWEVSIPFFVVGNYTTPHKLLQPLITREARASVGDICSRKQESHGRRHLTEKLNQV